MPVVPNLHRAKDPNLHFPSFGVGVACQRTGVRRGWEGMVVYLRGHRGLAAARRYSAGDPVDMPAGCLPLATTLVAWSGRADNDHRCLSSRSDPVRDHVAQHIDWHRPFGDEPVMKLGDLETSTQPPLRLGA